MQLKLQLIITAKICFTANYFFDESFTFSFDCTQRIKWKGPGERGGFKFKVVMAINEVAFNTLNEKPL